MHSLKSKFILIAVTLVLVPLLITNLFQYVIVTREYASTIEEKNQAVASSIASSVSFYIDGAFDVVSEIADEPAVTSFDRQVQRSILERAVQRNPEFDLLYIQGNDGMQTARSEGVVANRKDRWWFKQLQASQTSFVSKSYYSLFTKQPITSIFVPIADGKGTIIGSIGADIQMNELQEVVERNSFGKGSYSFIIDGEGVIVAHPNKQYVQEMYNLKQLTKTVWLKGKNGQELTDEQGNELTEEQSIDLSPELSILAKRALKGETGTGSYADSSKERFVAAFKPVKLPGSSERWAVISVQDEQKAYAFVYDIQKKVLWLSLVLAVSASLAIWFSSSLLIHPILGLVRFMEKAAHGDLTHRSQYKSKDEIGQLTASYNEMMDRIGSSLKDIKAAFSRVFSASNVLAETTQETSQSVTEVANSIIEVAESADEQSKMMQDGVQVTEELRAVLRQACDGLKMACSAAEETVASYEESAAAVQSFMEQQVLRRDADDEAADALGSISRKASLVHHRMKEFTDLAHDAAQAALGEEAADTALRRVAAHALHASRGMQGLVEEMNDELNELQRRMLAASAEASEHAEAANMRSNFEQLAAGLEPIRSQMISASVKLGQAGDKCGQLSAMIAGIATVSHRASDTAKSISAETQQQAAAMDEISHLSDSLNNSATLVAERIRSFRI
ncbi:methyl-accepting chemotaxis sensory transducer with Cache sensor [Paenibacillus taihuensis]|uniref:histidine kinase n=1 Tax=Paenibacillus taihuensis TaxID=1156355 RepID=A0A3D9RJZ6_9BACL|nr:methyl-accepting chemotaxis protein [Paenibacillus taihuensis]REE80203.1 methyl-accepting chemotaxis sensory transducer with Cache sensor [Paenibacillus taihuensis]